MTNHKKLIWRHCVAEPKQQQQKHELRNFVTENWRMPNPRTRAYLDLPDGGSNKLEHFDTYIWKLLSIMNATRGHTW